MLAKRKYKGIVFLLIFVAIIIPNFLKSQTDTTKTRINYGAMSQMHFSYAQSDSVENPYGFRLRRLDFKVWQAPTENINWSLLLGFGDFNFQILELDINYKLNSNVQFRVGQFAPPAARSGAPVDNLFKVPIMSFIERAPIAQIWKNKMNLHAYRTFGLQVHGKILNNKLYYGLMAGNPKGSSFFNASSTNVYHLNNENGLSLWGRLEYELMESFVTGVFYNTSNSISDGINFERESMGAHILHRRNNLSFMLEYIQGQNYADTVRTDYYRGYFIESAYRINKFEPAFRFDVYDPAIGDSDDLFVKQYYNYTLGLNFYPTKKIRFQFNYIIKNEQMESSYKSINNNLAYINFQFLL